MNRIAALLVFSLAACGGGTTTPTVDEPTLDLGGGDADTHPLRPAVARAGQLIADDRAADAVPLLEDAVREDPRDARAYLTLGIARTLLGDASAAEAAFRAALSVDPAYPEAWNELGLLFRDTERLPEGLSALQQAVRHRPEFHDAWYNLALAYEDAEQLDEAEAAYGHAIVGLGNDAIVRFHHGGLRARRGDRDGARVELRRAAELAGRQVDVLRAVGRALTSLGFVDDAADVLTGAVRVAEPPSTDLLIEAAGACRSARRGELAVRHAEEATRLDPLSVRAFAMLALVQTDAGQRAAALAALERADRLDGEGRLRADLARLRAAAEALP